MHVSKLTVLKGKTVEQPKNHWKKIEFTIEMSLDAKDNPEEAKELCDILLDAWLKEES